MADKNGTAQSHGHHPHGVLRHQSRSFELRKSKFQVQVDDGGELNNIEYSAGMGYEDTLVSLLTLIAHLNLLVMVSLNQTR